MSISVNEIIAENGAYGTTELSGIEKGIKLALNVPCIGEVVGSMSIGLLQVVQATFNSLKPLLEIYVLKLNLQSASLALTKIGLVSNLQVLNYTIQAAEKIISSLPVGTFGKCPVIGKTYDEVLKFVRRTNISARAADLSYKVAQITSIQTEVELGKQTTLELVRQIDVFLDVINQKIEELS